MRILLSVGVLLVILLVSALFAYYFRKRLLVIFGIVPLTRKDDGRYAVEGTYAQPQLCEDKGARALPGVAPPPAPAPMIVVADSGSRGEKIPYDVLAAACDRWHESRCIGSGAAAKVYRAELARYGAVAVKRFHPMKQGAVGRDFQRELQTLAQCRHPNVLEIIGHTDEGPENLILMPLMEGGTLSAALPGLLWDSRSLLVAQVVNAVSFLHGKQIMHRDIKGSNILLDGSQRHARLADFGLAKDQIHAGYKGTGSTGVIVGSPGYMAPELMMRPANERTDAFALGVVFLEILTGLPAWEQNSGIALTDRAVPADTSRFDEKLLHVGASWPVEEAAIVAEKAVALTLFDPSRRKTVIEVEQDSVYRGHQARAESSEKGRRGDAAPLPPPAVVGMALG